MSSRATVTLDSPFLDRIHLVPIHRQRRVHNLEAQRNSKRAGRVAAVGRRDEQLRRRRAAGRSGRVLSRAGRAEHGGMTRGVHVRLDRRSAHVADRSSAHRVSRSLSAMANIGSDPFIPPNPRSVPRDPDAGPSSHAVSSNTPSPPPAPPMHLSLLPLLRCPVCHARLHAPTTLRCGHSVCAHHLRPCLSHCPVPRCSHPAPSHPIIPPTSSVAYHPAPSSSSSSPSSSVLPLPQRVDVTLSKVLDLIVRVQPDPATPTNSEDSEDSPNVQSISPASSYSRRRPRSADEANRPRKRRRHRPPTCDTDDGPDLLSHLVAASARQRSVRHDQPLSPPSPPPTASDLFEKNLLAELTCEICFNLFYDPITTPCQHASLPSVLLVLHFSVSSTDFLHKMSTPCSRSRCYMPSLPTRPPWLPLFSRASPKSGHTISSYVSLSFSVCIFHIARSPQGLSCSLSRTRRNNRSRGARCTP